MLNITFAVKARRGLEWKGTLYNGEIPRVVLVNFRFLQKIVCLSFNKGLTVFEKNKLDFCFFEEFRFCDAKSWSWILFHLDPHYHKG